MKDPMTEEWARQTDAKIAAAPKQDVTPAHKAALDALEVVIRNQMGKTFCVQLCTDNMAALDVLVAAGRMEWHFPAGLTDQYAGFGGSTKPLLSEEQVDVAMRLANAYAFQTKAEHGRIVRSRDALRVYLTSLTQPARDLEES